MIRFCIFTGDGKWIFYDDIQCKRQWIGKGESPQPIPNAGLHERKVLLYGGIIAVSLILSL